MILFEYSANNSNLKIEKHECSIILNCVHCGYHSRKLSPMTRLEVMSLSGRLHTLFE